MPLTKNCNLRYQVIDHCLQSPSGMTLSQLREACNAKLTLAGYNPIGPKSKNTLLGDIEFMMNYYNAPIEGYHDGRYVYYKYSNPKFSIFKSTLPEEDIFKIHQTLQMLGNFEGRVNFEWIEDFKLKLNSIIKDSGNSRPVISYEENSELTGKEFITPLFDAITSKRAISISYKPFVASEPQKKIVHPYFLKQYNNRWFLLCRTDGFKKVSILALDRIFSIGPAPVEYQPNTEIDFEEYFDDIIGVTRKEGDEPQTISIWVSAHDYPYIATKPLHWSQRLIKQTKDGVIITINVIPNYEMEQLLLSYGEGIQVLSPVQLKDKIESRIKLSLNNYQTVRLD